MLPDITHLQFAVLKTLIGSKKTGQEIRRTLKEEGHSKSLAAFYQLMSRLEDMHMVSMKQRKSYIDGHMVTENIYSLDAKGARAIERARQFYSDGKALPSGLEVQS